MTRSTLPRLRRYRGTDAAFVRELGARAFSEYSPRAGTGMPNAADRGSAVIVAELGEVAVGFAVVTFENAGPRRGVASLDAIAVVEAERGRGVGRALLRGAERVARTRGAAELRLVTAQANVAALDLFLRAGFDTERRLARYYPRGQDAISMRKRLP